jgi:hypothetical protein
LFAPLLKWRRRARRGGLLAVLLGLLVAGAATADIVTVTGGELTSWSTMGVNSGTGLILEAGSGSGYACDGLLPGPPPDSNTGPATCALAGVPEDWGLAAIYSGQFDDDTLEGSIAWTGDSGNEASTTNDVAGSGLFTTTVTDGGYDLASGIISGEYSCWNNPSRLLANFCGNSTGGAIPDDPPDPQALSSRDLHLGATGYIDLNNGTVLLQMEDDGFQQCLDAPPEGECTDNGASNKVAIFTLTTTGSAIATAGDDEFDVQVGSAPTALAIGANDVSWFDEAAITEETAGDQGGTFVINNSATPGAPGNVTVTYTPVGAFEGTETWEYRVTDTMGPNNPANSDTATVTINVLPPGAHDDSATTHLTSAVVIATGANDYGFVGNTTVTIVTAPTAGALVINDGGDASAITIEYTPDEAAGLNSPGYQDTFTYSLLDTNENAGIGGGSASATVTIDVTNQLPVANDLAGVVLDTQGVDPATVSTTVNVYVGGDIQGNEFGDLPSVVTTTPSSNGDVSTTVASTVITIQAVSFASDGDTFAYTITDSDDEESTGTISVVITDVSPAVSSVGQIVAEKAPVTVTVPFILGNGAVGDHTATMTAPQFGTITDVQVNTQPDTVTFDYTADGTEGTDVITLTLTDGDGSEGTGEIRVTITGDAVKFPQQETLPGSSSALSPWSLLALLIGAPLLRRRRHA